MHNVTKCQRCKEYVNIFKSATVDGRTVCPTCVIGIRGNYEYKMEKYGEKNILVCIREAGKSNVAVYETITE